MRRSNRLRAGLSSRPAASPQQVEVVDIDDDLTDFPSETTLNPIATPNPITSPPLIPQSPPQIVQITQKGRVKKWARKTPTKKVPRTTLETESETHNKTFHGPQSNNETQPETQNGSCPQPPIDNVLEPQTQNQSRSQPPIDNVPEPQHKIKAASRPQPQPIEKARK